MKNKINVALIGYGKINKELEKILLTRSNYIIIKKYTKKTIAELLNLSCHVDLIIDFSNAQTFKYLYAFLCNHVCALLSGTSGYSTNEIEQLKELGRTHRIFYSTNYAYGMVLVMRMIAELSNALINDYDIEIVETHHQNKIDSPSGTTISLIGIIQQTQPMNVVYGRAKNGSRFKNEIGVHSIRGGQISGIHEINFIGQNESIQIKHNAFSNRIYLDGIIKSLRFLNSQGNGYYSSEDILNIKEGKHNE